MLQQTVTFILQALVFSCPLTHLTIVLLILMFSNIFLSHLNVCSNRILKKYTYLYKFILSTSTHDGHNQFSKIIMIYIIYGPITSISLTFVRLTIFIPLYYDFQFNFIGTVRRRKINHIKCIHKIIILAVNKSQSKLWWHEIDKQFIYDSITKKSQQ